MNLFELYKTTVAERDQISEMLRYDQDSKGLQRQYWELVGEVNGIVKSYAAITGFDNREAHDELVGKLRVSKLGIEK
jgi:hypothetical protein